MTVLGNIRDEDYFARTEISNSDLSMIDLSYAHYLEKERKHVTEAMTFGKAFDQYLLRPSEFHLNFVIAPEDMDRRTAAGKQTYRDLINSGRTVLTVKDWTNLNIMKDNVNSHPIASNIIKNSENEGSFTGIIEGVEVRCKVDLINQNYLFDVKTCQSARASEFKKDVANRNYHRQMAFYLEILRQNMEGIKGAGLIPVEKPSDSNFIPKNCGVNVFWVTQDDLDQGKFEFLKLVDKYKTYRDNPNKYPGYSDEIEPLSLPLWRKQGDFNYV